MIDRHHEHLASGPRETARASAKEHKLCSHKELAEILAALRLSSLTLCPLIHLSEPV